MDDVAQPQSPEGRDRQVKAGFAKVRGQGWEFFMQKYKIILGRNSKNSAVDVDLAKNGGGMNVSRRHAKIYYNFDNKRFEIEVLGKNGAYIDGELRVPSDGPTPLNSQSFIVIGDFPFYFLLPTKKIDRAGKRRTPEHSTLTSLDTDYNRPRQEDTDLPEVENGAAEELENGDFEAGYVSEGPAPEDEKKQKPRKRKPDHEDNAEERRLSTANSAQPPDVAHLQGGEGQAKKRKGGVKRFKRELPEEEEEEPQAGVTQLTQEASRGTKAEMKGEDVDELPPKEIHPEQKPRKKKENAPGKSGVLPEASSSKRQDVKSAAEEKTREESAPDGGQKKALKKKKVTPPSETEIAREGSPEPTFQGRNLRVASPPKRNWTGESEAKPVKPTPASPTRAGTKRAAAESAAADEGSARKGASKAGAGEMNGVLKGEGKRKGDEGQVVAAIAEILGGQEDPSNAMPMNKIFMQFSERHPELYERSKGLLSDGAEGDASEHVHRPWLALASFLKRHPKLFVVESQTKGRLVSLYASLRQK